MRAFRTLLLIVPILIACSDTSAQVYEVTGKAAVANFQVRMQRQERSAASCVIVYPDHRAHYEMITGLGTQVYEGPLTEDNVRQLESILSPLATINPSEIVHKSQMSELDMVIINLMTTRGLSNLTFSDPSARKPFKTAVDPALKFLASARKGLPSLPESRKNNCVPENGAATPKAEPPLMSARQAHLLSEHLLFRSDIFRVDEGVVNDSCVAVGPDGRYRYETRTTSEAGSISTARVFEGVVDATELARLREILAAPELANSTHFPELPNGVRARNSEMVELAIPREDHLQRLRFYAISGLAYQEPTPAAQVTTTNTDSKLLKPIRSWMKDSVEKRKGVTPISGATPNRCSGMF